MKFETGLGLELELLDVVLWKNKGTGGDALWREKLFSCFHLTVLIQ